eukprot:4542674-Prorocentrum_lima.AAC.1
MLMAGPIKPVGLMCAGKQGSNEALQFGEVFGHCHGKCVSAHSAEGILGIEGHHHGVGAA